MMSRAFVRSKSPLLEDWAESRFGISDSLQWSDWNKSELKDDDKQTA